MEGAALLEDRVGITFGVELYVPWDAPEAVVDIHSEGVVLLGSIPDVVGLVGRRPDATGSRILQGRDVMPSDTVSPPAELRDESPQQTRRAHRRIRPVRVMTGSVSDLPILTLQDPADAQGALVYDCRPPLLPVSLQLSDLGAFARLRPEASASVSVAPREERSSIGDVDSDMVVFPDLGVAPLIDSGTDLEDELPTPDDSPGSVTVGSAGAVEPEVRPTPRGGFDMELAKVRWYRR